MQNQSIDITVIVPIYNVEQYVERCLRSLFTQTKTEGVEFLLVNDSTPDGSMAIVRRVAAEFPTLDIRIIENAENRGIGTTRIIGLEAARGEYIQFIDSDDWIEPTTLEELWTERLRTNSDIIIFDYMNRFARRDVRAYNSIPKDGDTAENISALLQENFAFGVVFKFTKRSLYTQADITNMKGAEGLNMAEDMLLSVMLLLVAKRVSHLARVLYNYDRSNEGSLTAQTQVALTHDLEQALTVAERALTEAEVLNDELRALLQQRTLAVVMWRLLLTHSVAEQRAVVAPYLHLRPHLGQRKGPLKHRLALRAAFAGHLWLFNLLMARKRKRIYTKRSKR